MANKYGPPQLPAVLAQLATTDGRITPQWYNALQRVLDGLQGQVTNIQDIIDDIKALAIALGATDGDPNEVVNIIDLINSKANKTTKVSTTGSLAGGGTLANDITLQLDGDVSDPPASEYYGTDATGVKGWFPLTSGVASLDGFTGVVNITNDDPSIIVRDLLNTIYLSVNIVDGGMIAAAANTRVTSTGDIRTTSTGDIRITA